MPNIYAVIYIGVKEKEKEMYSGDPKEKKVNSD